jgi:hypothetical protein
MVSYWEIINMLSNSKILNIGESNISVKDIICDINSVNTDNFKESREYKIMSNIITQQSEEINAIKADLEELKKIINSILNE